MRSKNTEARRNLLLQAIGVGMSHSAASSVAGISSSTFHKWIEESGKFRRQVELAEGEAEARMTNVIVTAANNGDWRAGVAWLERRRPKDWRMKNSENEDSGNREELVREIDELLEELRLNAIEDAERRLETAMSQPALPSPDYAESEDGAGSMAG